MRAQLYAPSNATEGDLFMAQWCRTCRGYMAGDCNILLRAYTFKIDEPDYPRQWISDGAGGGRCTAHTSVKTLTKADQKYLDWLATKKRGAA